MSSNLHDLAHGRNPSGPVTPTVFAIEQVIARIKQEIREAPPFHARNNERRAEIDQLTDMLERRR